MFLEASYSAQEYNKGLARMEQWYVPKSNEQNIR